MLKTLAFALLLTSGTTALLHADELIQNGTFVDGIEHWHGDARSPADFASDNPMQASNPLLSKGMIIPLGSSHWTKVAQDFKGKGTKGTLTITYKVSPDFSLSGNAEDYKNVTGQIGYFGWKPFNAKPGEWVVIVSDFGSARGTYYKLKTKTGGEMQGMRAPVKGLTPYEDKTITLAFPPGRGDIIIMGVSFTDN